MKMRPVCLFRARRLSRCAKITLAACGALALLLWRLGGSWTFARKVRRWSREPREETAALIYQLLAVTGVLPV